MQTKTCSNTYLASSFILRITPTFGGFHRLSSRDVLVSLTHSPTVCHTRLANLLSTQRYPNKLWHGFSTRFTLIWCLCGILIASCSHPINGSSRRQHLIVREWCDRDPPSPSLSLGCRIQQRPHLHTHSQSCPAPWKNMQIHSEGLSLHVPSTIAAIAYHD
jgi:hypothetical protein